MDNKEINQDDLCDIHPDKVCDSCCQCIEVTQDYIEIPVRYVEEKGDQ